jgi:uracil-DNA glycosylase
MSTKLSPEQKRNIAARFDFYRELGIHSFYRRGKAPMSLAPEPLPAEALAAPKLPIIQGDKSVALTLVRGDIGDCTRCRLHKGRTNLVFGVGNVDADIMFVGEGPGADEDVQGEPFVGRAGQLLNNMIQAMGLRREDVYIANVVKCRPPGNRTPERDECDTCGPFLMRQIEIIQPRMIVALGATAAKYLVGINDSMNNLRGRIYEFKNSKLVVTYHPAYLLRDPRQKAEAWKDLQLVMKHLGMAVPKKT